MRAHARYSKVISYRHNRHIVTHSPKYYIKNMNINPESQTPHNVRTTSPRSGGLGGLPLSKSSLAQRYFPGRTLHSATNRLREWINRNRSLRDALAATGYTDRQRILTVRQVRLIVKYLGEP